MLKTIAGHTSVRGICRYLTRKDRALASDYLNIDSSDLEHPDAAFDWAAVMDATRRTYGNDLPWRGKRVRTYKHYVVSPDPKDGVVLEELRALATTWAAEHFSEYEVAIVYHDDNQNGIPHAHVVVNNTNLESGRRLQDPDPKALASSLQEIAEGQGLTALHPPEPTGVAARAAKRHPRAHPATYRSEYLRRAERELTERGEYSWISDIRARVRIARAASRSVEDFRALLSSMGVEVSDNSPKAQRRDWIYALAEHPARRISGERLGLSYSRERLEPMLRMGGANALSGESRHAASAIAARAVEVGDLEQLGLLSQAVALIERSRIRSLADLDTLVGSMDVDAAVASYVRSSRLLPETALPVQVRQPARMREPREGGLRGEEPFDRRIEPTVLRQDRQHDDRREGR